MNELKPCPFCGGHAGREGTSTISCQKCGITTGWHMNPSSAVKTWNRRVNNDN